MSLSKGNTILVTGYAGFIGSHLTERLLKDGYQVIGVDNFNDYYDPNIKERNVKDLAKDSKFKQYRLDILNTDGLEKVFKENRVGLVIHLAARAGVRPSLKNPELYQQVNIQGTKNLLKMMKKYQTGRLIFGSSSSLYGNQKKVPFAETDKLEKPVSPYAETKLEAEKLCQQYAEKDKIKTTVLRFFTVYGPRGRPDMAPYLFTGKILAGKPITKYGDGSSSRDYTYIDDIVAGIMAAVKNPFEFEVINLGNNKPVSLNDFISSVEKLVGKKAIIRPAKRHPADVKRTWADITKAQKLLGWQPKVELEQGMKWFVDWFKNQVKT